LRKPSGHKVNRPARKVQVEIKSGTVPWPIKRQVEDFYKAWKTGAGAEH